jgi:hypothetical protein
MMDLVDEGSGSGVGQSGLLNILGVGVGNGLGYGNFLDDPADRHLGLDLGELRSDLGVGSDWGKDLLLGDQLVEMRSLGTVDNGCWGRWDGSVSGISSGSCDVVETKSLGWGSGTDLCGGGLGSASELWVLNDLGVSGVGLDWSSFLLLHNLLDWSRLLDNGLGDLDGLLFLHNGGGSLNDDWSWGGSSNEGGLSENRCGKGVGGNGRLEDGGLVASDYRLAFIVDGLGEGDLDLDLLMGVGHGRGMSIAQGGSSGICKSMSVDEGVDGGELTAWGGSCHGRNDQKWEESQWRHDGVSES